MKKYLKKILWLFAATILISSCSKEEVIENSLEILDGKILVNTEIIIDGVIQTDTRAVSEAGYTTGDGLYHRDDPVTVAAFANEGYELVTFYDKKYPTINLGSSHTFPAMEPQTFKAEFARIQNYTISVTANPTAGGTVSGGGSYKGGSSCTIVATSNSGYVFDGWYESGTKISSDVSYTFTVSSNRTITAEFIKIKVVIVGATGCIISPFGVKRIGVNSWKGVAYGNGKYIAVKPSGYSYEPYSYITTSTDGINWSEEIQVDGCQMTNIEYVNGIFIATGSKVQINNKDLYNIAVSSDGKNWTLKTVEHSSYDVVYANGKFVAVGYQRVYISPDGENWTSKKIDNVPNNMAALVYGDGKFVAVGLWGRIISSTDGENWTEVQIGDCGFQGIAYGNGKFVAVTIEGFIMNSIDGINWTSKRYDFTWNNIIFHNDNFIVIGDSGYTATSIDGETWTTPEQLKDENGTDITSTLYGICGMP